MPEGLRLNAGFVVAHSLGLSFLYNNFCSFGSLFSLEQSYLWAFYGESPQILSGNNKQYSSFSVLWGLSVKAH